MRVLCRHWVLLELQLDVVVSCLIWVLRSELEFSVRAGGDFNSWVTSPAQCMHVCLLVDAGAHRSQRHPTLGLGLQGVVNHLIWVLDPNLGPL